MPKRKLSVGLYPQHDSGDDQSEWCDSPIEEKIIRTGTVDRCGDPGGAFEEIIIKIESDDVPSTHDGEVSTFKNLGGASLLPRKEGVSPKRDPEDDPLRCSDSLLSAAVIKTEEPVDRCIGSGVTCEQQYPIKVEPEDPSAGDGESASLSILNYSSLFSKVVIVNPQHEPEGDQSGCRNDPLLDEETMDADEPFDRCGGDGPAVTYELKHNLESDDSLAGTSSTSTTGKHQGVSYRDKFFEAAYKRLALESKYDELKSNFTSKVECPNEAKGLEVMPVIEKVELDAMNDRKVKWTDLEMVRALTLRSLSTRTYSYLRKTKSYPIPGISSLKRWARRTMLRNGILHNVVKLMKFVSKGLSAEEKMCVLLIDEVLLSESIEYDENVDEITGPFSHMQMVLAQSLVGSWIQPVFVDFNAKITKFTLLSITSALYDAGYVVVCCVNDCSDKSLSLWKELGASMDQPHFPHPFTGEPVVCMCDALTLLRTIRDKLLNKGFYLNGCAVHREPLDALLRLVASDREICPKLEDIHLLLYAGQCSTMLAVQLFSNSVAKALSLYTPGKSEVEAKNISNLFNVLNSWFDMMNVDSDDPASEQASPFKSPYGSHLDDQNKLLSNLCSTMKTAKMCDDVMPPFRVGFVMSCTALPILLETSLRYGIKSILTRNLTFDWIKNLFITVQVDGAKTTPMKALKRLREVLFDKIPCHRNEWDPTPTPYFLFPSAFRKASLDPKEILDYSGSKLLECNFDCIIPPFLDEPDLPLNILSLMALAVALNFKNKYSNLCKSCHDLVVQTWSSGSDIPTDYFLGCIVKMEKLFLNYIKNNDVLRVPGLTRILSKRMKSCLKLSLPVKVIRCFVKLRLSTHAKHYMRHTSNQRVAQLSMKRLIKLNFLKALKKTANV